MMRDKGCGAATRRQLPAVKRTARVFDHLRIANARAIDLPTTTQEYRNVWQYTIRLLFMEITNLNIRKKEDSKAILNRHDLGATPDYMQMPPVRHFQSHKLRLYLRQTLL